MLIELSEEEIELLKSGKELTRDLNPKFIQFLSEANYGALQTDGRITFIRKLIIRDIKRKVRNSQPSDISFNGMIPNVNIRTKYKTENLTIIRLFWELQVTQSKNPNANFCYHASEQQVGDNAYKIILICNKKPNQNISEFREELPYLIDNEMDVHLNHEIKHLLDDIDGIFTKSDYHPANKTFHDMVKYIQQDKELQNFLISVIEDLNKIKRKNPEITYKDAINKSSMYKQVFEFLGKNKNKEIADRKKISKFKSKLVHFWNETYGSNQ